MTEAMKITDIRQLTVFDILMIVFVTLFFPTKRREYVSFPQKAGEFNFVKPIMENRHHNYFQFAHYERSGITYFAKMLSVRWYSLENYWFRKELRTLKIAEIAAERMSAGREPEIDIPHICGIFESRESILAIYSYIPDASTLEEDDMPLSERVVYMEKVHSYIRNLNMFIRPEERSELSRRPNIYYALSFWPILIRALLRFPEKRKEIFLLTLKFLRASRLLFRRHELAFTHRDINPSNILIAKNKKIYAIDFEVSTVAHPIVQVAGISVAAGRRPGLLDIFDKTPTMQGIYNNKKDLEAFTFFAVYACIYSMALTPSWRFDRSFKFLDYCLKLR